LTPISAKSVSATAGKALEIACHGSNW